ncbi:hypothetical protein MMYC01_200858 [Madurella mycetomatis]|uniref:Uncharacterized protein n=1 Tax=Madurella mycetomatis TaxID=100816 RepID=A0A175WFW9_9PEZI|nr:hypothetical protein MMYC01_200858 [Madurella mycetomatis]
MPVRPREPRWVFYVITATGLAAAALTYTGFCFPTKAVNTMHLLKSVLDERPRPRDQNKALSRVYFVVLCLLPAFATSLALWGVLHAWRNELSSIPYHHQRCQGSSTKPHRLTACGSTPADAEARGCRFDILSFAWQTPECYDDELMEEFIRYDKWQFYAQPNRTDVVVDLATALRGKRTLYVDWKYHVTHCTFMWRQMHRAYALRGYIDSHLDSYEHTLHCQRVLMDTETPLGMNSAILFKVHTEAGPAEEVALEIQAVLVQDKNIGSDTPTKVAAFAADWRNRLMGSNVAISNIIQADIEAAEQREGEVC